MKYEKFMIKVSFDCGMNTNEGHLDQVGEGKM